MRLVVHPAFADAEAAVKSASPDEALVILADSEENAMDRLKAIRHGAFDCDGTLTSDNGWAKCQPLMLPSARRQEEAERTWFYSQTRFRVAPPSADAHWWLPQPLDASGGDWFVSRPLDEQDQTLAESAWGARSIMRLVAAMATADQVAEVGQSLTPRDGLTELFAAVDEKVVVSFGIEDVIRAFLDKLELSADIAAWRLTYEQVDGPTRYVSGHHQASIVTSGNKGRAVNAFQHCRKVANTELLTVFDNPVVDRGMITENAFNVLLLPAREADRRLHAFREAHLEHLWNPGTHGWHRGIDMILRSDSLTPLVELIHAARG